MGTLRENLLPLLHLNEPQGGGVPFELHMTGFTLVYWSDMGQNGIHLNSFLDKAVSTFQLNTLNSLRGNEFIL